MDDQRDGESDHDSGSSEESSDEDGSVEESYDADVNHPPALVK